MGKEPRDPKKDSNGLTKLSDGPISPRTYMAPL